MSLFVKWLSRLGSKSCLPPKLREQKTKKVAYTKIKLNAGRHSTWCMIYVHSQVSGAGAKAKLVGIYNDHQLIIVGALL